MFKESQYFIVLPGLLWLFLKLFFIMIISKTLSHNKESSFSLSIFLKKYFILLAAMARSSSSLNLVETSNKEWRSSYLNQSTSETFH